MIRTIVTSSILIGFLLCGICVAANTAVAQNAVDGRYFDTLQERLIKDGFEEHTIRSIYSRSEVTFETKGISLYFVHRESNVRYHQYTEASQIKRAKKYMEVYQEQLQFAEQTYGVDKQVITAIILVETQLGKLMGNRSVLNTLSTMAALFDPQVRDLLWDKISGTPKLTRKVYEQKAKRRSEWAYRELQAFLYHVELEGYDPVAINGSFAGAMGIAQFMPSNIFELAKDGNRDGRINLFDHADAIASIAYYLKRHGWYPGIRRSEAEKVIYHYNHSEQYVDTILEISDLLKGQA